MVKSIRFATLPVLGLLGALAVNAGTAYAYNREVTVINHTHHTITSFYASNVDQSTWEGDILGDDVVPPGRSVDIDLADGSGYCRFDFKTVFDDGTSITRHSVNVCSVGTYTVYE